ncbi:hypothetical protein ACFRAQ_02730 [Nocardia sp. NPDC056611]|uniref:hypothetical protein n=1 Tax=Nocardia sp. NPDC056611 TaxID=3345877 RepID=UPI00366CE232
MSTSEQRARARKTRRHDDGMPERPVKTRRGQRDRSTSPDLLLSSWTCEGQLELFDMAEEVQR